MEKRKYTHLKAAAGFSAVNRKEVRPKVKYAVIYRHRNEYPVSAIPDQLVSELEQTHKH